MNRIKNRGTKPPAGNEILLILLILSETLPELFLCKFSRPGQVVDMIPDEEPAGAAGPAQATPSKGRRRSRRGGRRHPRRRDPRPAGEPSGAGQAATEPYAPVAPAAETEGEAERAPEPSSAHAGSAVSQAIDQVTQVIEELKRALDEMEEVLETLELAERQKIDDEREIESLQRALRRLHRPASAGEQHR
jgi:hypothetical protein